MFPGKMANLTYEVSVLAMSTRLPFTGQAEEAYPDFMLHVLREKLDYKPAMRIFGRVLQSCSISSDRRLFMLSSFVLIGSVSQITFSLKCDYNIPPAITIITYM